MDMRNSSYNQRNKRILTISTSLRKPERVQMALMLNVRPIVVSLSLHCRHCTSPSLRWWVSWCRAAFLFLYGALPHGVQESIVQLIFSFSKFRCNMILSDYNEWFTKSLHYINYMRSDVFPKTCTRQDIGDTLVQLLYSSTTLMR